MIYYFLFKQLTFNTAAWWEAHFFSGFKGKTNVLCTVRRVKKQHLTESFSGLQFDKSSLLEKSQIFSS